MRHKQKLRLYYRKQQGESEVKETRCFFLQYYLRAAVFPRNTKRHSLKHSPTGIDPSYRTAILSRRNTSYAEGDSKLQLVNRPKVLEESKRTTPTAVLFRNAVGVYA